jgi:hypothetical protein
MRSIAVFTILLAGFAPQASAQSYDWLVLPTTTDEDPSWLGPTTYDVGRALSDAGVNVWAPEAAVARFEQKGSAPSVEVTDTDIEEWVARSQAAIRHLARGDYATALKELKKAQVISRKAADELNREQARAQNVLDTCLYMVRALLETGNRTRAKAQVQECVRLVPQGQPNPHMHPPNVIALYEEASTPGPEQTGSLSVESQPSGCEARINGVKFGQTPFEMGDLYPGEYRVQVECEPGRRGRVHSVQVGTGRVSVFVEVEFDRAIRTEPVLRLRYPEPADEQQMDRDAQNVAKVLPAAAVVLASMTAIDTMELRVLSGSEKRVGLARIPTTANGPKPADISAAAAVLVAGECKDFTGPKPVPVDCKSDVAEAREKKTEPVAASASDRPPPAKFISGTVLVSLGGAALVTGYALQAVNTKNGKNLDPSAASYAEDSAQWLNFFRATNALAAVGAVTAVTAMPLILPYRSKTPWWAWLSGGLGVAAAAGSIAVGVTGALLPSQCPPDEYNRCADGTSKAGLAILLGATAAPLLTMPLVYLFRKGEKKPSAALAPAIQISHAGGAFSLRGAF